MGQIGMNSPSRAYLSHPAYLVLNVRFGSKAVVHPGPPNVRFAPIAGIRRRGHHADIEDRRYLTSTSIAWIVPPAEANVRTWLPGKKIA